LKCIYAIAKPEHFTSIFGFSGCIVKFKALAILGLYSQTAAVFSDLDKMQGPTSSPLQLAMKFHLLGTKQPRPRLSCYDLGLRLPGEGRYLGFPPTPPTLTPLLVLGLLPGSPPFYGFTSSRKPFPQPWQELVFPCSGFWVTWCLPHSTSLVCHGKHTCQAGFELPGDQGPALWKCSAQCLGQSRTRELQLKGTELSTGRGRARLGQAGPAGRSEPAHPGPSPRPSAPLLSPPSSPSRLEAGDHLEKGIWELSHRQGQGIHGVVEREKQHLTDRKTC
jgi:hypothetical protein